MKWKKGYISLQRNVIVVDKIKGQYITDNTTKEVESWWWWKLVPKKKK